MQLKQYYLDCLAHASYMIGDDQTKTAVVVDPQRDVAQYLADAERSGFAIRHVFLTHFHADFVAGHLELKARTGATIHLGARAEAEFEFDAMSDGDTLEIGSLKIEILETPGHTPEGISLVIFDLEKSDSEPRAVLTGDALFIGDVGRPDLMASAGVSARELAGELYHSLHDKLMKLPDSTLVYPAHGAGSMCGKSLSEERVSTIGTQKQENYALQPMDKETFVTLVTKDQPAAPSYFSYDAQMNKTNRPVLFETMAELPALSLDEVQSLVKDKNAQVVDVRPPEDFASAHMKGSFNIELEGRFATWAGTLLDPERPIVLIADAGTEVEAQLRLGRIGYDLVAGFLDGGMRALASAPEVVDHYERISAARLAEELETTRPFVVDVRTPSEYVAGHIPGAVNIPLNELSQRLNELPADRPLVATCRTGSRSSSGLSIIRAAGLDQATDQRGGFEAWQDGKRPVTQGEHP